ARLAHMKRAALVAILALGLLSVTVTPATAWRGGGGRVSVFVGSGYWWGPPYPYWAYPPPYYVYTPPTVVVESPPVYVAQPPVAPRFAATPQRAAMPLALASPARMEPVASRTEPIACGCAPRRTRHATPWAPARSDHPTTAAERVRRDEEAGPSVAARSCSRRMAGAAGLRPGSHAW